MSLRYLFTGPDASTDDEAERHAMARAPRWCGLYAIADTLAMTSEARFRRDIRYFVWLAAAALGCAAFFSVFSNQTLLLAGYISVALLLLLVLLGMHRGAHHRRYLDYRALTEGLRIGIFWKLAGIATGSFGGVGELYPMKQGMELAWTKTCLRSLDLLDSLQATFAGTPLDQRAYSWVRNLWIIGQYRYCYLQSIRYRMVARKYERWSLALVLLAALCVAPLALVLDYQFKGEAPGSWHFLLERLALIPLLTILPGLAALIWTYSQQIAIRAQAEQYDRMRALLERTYQSLPETIGADRSRQIQAFCIELGAEVMKEHTAWISMFRPAGAWRDHWTRMA
jgi:hypothetical protein